MSDILELIKSLAGINGKVNYVPWNIEDVEIFYGVPPILIQGVDAVRAYRSNPAQRFVPSLTGRGVFVQNQNWSGIIEVDLLNASASCAAIEALELIGIPFPLAVVDKTTNGLGSAIGTSCRVVGTPHWHRAKMPGLYTYTFAATNLVILNGMKNIQSS